MKILHTSDWHLGRSLYGRKRYEEFSAFLDWLAQTIEEKTGKAITWLTTIEDLKKEILSLTDEAALQ